MADMTSRVTNCIISIYRLYIKKNVKVAGEKIPERRKETCQRNTPEKVFDTKILCISTESNTYF